MLRGWRSIGHSVLDEIPVKLSPVSSGILAREMPTCRKYPKRHIPDEIVSSDGGSPIDLWNI